MFVREETTLHRFEPMPHFVTFDNFTARPTIRPGGVENGYRLKDVIITSFDNNDSNFQPSNQFESKAIVHPSFQPEADGFMKLGDIKGDAITVDPKTGDKTDRFTTGGGGDSINSWRDVRDHNHGKFADDLTNAGQQGYTEVEWTHLKGDVWTNGSATSIRDGIKGSGFHGGLAHGAVHPDTPMDTHPNDNLLGHIGSGADALTNYRPEGFSEVEIHFVNPNAGQKGFTWEAAADIWTNGGASTFNAHALTQKVQHGCFEMQSGFSTENLDTGLRSDNRFVIEPVNLLQGLDAGSMNYAEAVGLDSSTLATAIQKPMNELIS